MADKCQRIQQYQSTLIQSGDSYFDQADLPEIPKLNRYTYSGISNSSGTEYILGAKFSYQESTQSMTFLQSDHLVPSLENIVDELKMRLQISPNLILYLLYSFKWNQEKLLQDYYTSGLFEKYRLKDFELESPKKQNFGQCSVCLIQQKLIQSDFCYHKYCRKCWQSYIAQKLYSNEIFSNCLDQCSQTPVLQSFIKKYTPSLREVFLKKIGMNYCLLNKNISYCPNEKCSLFCQKPLELTQKKVICPCGHIYCFQCRQENHLPLNCDDAMKWKDLVNQESECLQWIQRNTKTCPRCKVSVQKSIGCNKMKCICGCEFCFQCLTKWDEVHLKSDQCPSLPQPKLQHKFSMQEKQFLKIYEESIQINKKMKKDYEIIEHCSEAVHDERILQKLADIKYEIKCAWLIHKWIKIGIYLLQKIKIQSMIENDYLLSIRQLVREIQKLRYGYQKMTDRQLHNEVDLLVQNKAKLQKCQSSYLQAWYIFDCY